MSTLNNNTIHEQLVRSLPELDQKILIHECRTLSEHLDGLSGELYQRIIRLLDETAAFRYRIYSEFMELNRTVPNQRDTERKTDLCMDFLATFTPADALPGDRRAFHRWMDLSAVRERARVAMHESDRLGEMLLHLLRETLIGKYRESGLAEIQRIMQEEDLPKKLEAEVNDSPRWQNRVTVLKIWDGLVRTGASEAVEALCPAAWQQRMIDLMATPEENIWVQIQAFKTMAFIRPEQCLAMIHHRFTTPSDRPDDVFLRTHLLDVLDAHFPVSDKSPVIRDIFRRPDPSEHVRIKAALHLSRMSGADSLPVIRGLHAEDAGRPETEKVLAASGISLGKLILKAAHKDIHGQSFRELLGALRRILDHSRQCRVQQALVEGVDALAAWNAGHHPCDTVDALDFEVLQILDHVISEGIFHPRVRRRASELRERIILNRDPDARELMEKIRYYRREIEPGDYFTVASSEIPGEVILGRVLAWASVHDYGYYAQPGRQQWKIYRGEHYRRRIWRFLHEIRHPDPAKRQGFVHTVGRWYPGPVRAHARYMAETTETKVPGERLFHQEEHSWRPYLPTVDDILSLSHSRFAGKSIRIYSCEGVFTVRGSPALQDRLMNGWDITVNYGSLVAQRNVELSELRTGHARSFTQVLSEDMNVKVGFEPHRYEFDGTLYQVIDPDVALHLYPAVKNQMEWRPLT